MTFASPLRASSNGTAPSAFDTLPLRLAASAESVPSNDVVPGRAAVNRTVPPLTVMFASGTSIAVAPVMLRDPIQRAGRARREIDRERHLALGDLDLALPMAGGTGAACARGRGAKTASSAASRSIRWDRRMTDLLSR